MQAKITYCVKNGEEITIPASTVKRKITIPLLMAFSGGKSERASQALIINGTQVATAELNTGNNVYGTIFTSINSWSGTILENQTMRVKLQNGTNKYSSVPEYITVYVE